MLYALLVAVEHGILHRLAHKSTALLSLTAGLLPCIRGVLFLPVPFGDSGGCLACLGSN